MRKFIRASAIAGIIGGLGFLAAGTSEVRAAIIIDDPERPTPENGAFRYDYQAFLGPQQ